jgi:glucose uptake protein
MVSAIWGVFVWKEFRGAGPEAKFFLALMFVFFIVGLACVGLAPVISF